MGTYKRRHLSKKNRIDEIKKASEREIRLQEALKNHKRVRRIPFEIIIEEFYINGTSDHQGIVPFTSHYHVYFKNLSRRRYMMRRTRFKELLLFLYKNKCYRLLQEQRYINVVFNMAWYTNHFESDYRTWKRKSHNSDKQILSLLEHCFEKYEVPKFLYSTWFTSDKKQISWFIELTNGGSIRSLKLPIQLTKKGAHFFRTAPDDYNVFMALRWAQSLSYGADEVFADYIANTFLSRNHFENEFFWDKVIQFMSKQTMLDLQKTGELLDYLYHCIDEDDSYVIKGRTITSLMRASDQWHIEINRTSKQGKDLIWEASSISPLTVVEGKEEKRVTYRLSELRSTKELRIEGRRMNHCVVSYASSCYRKRTSIFTLRKESVLNYEEILATIEVNISNRMIVQSKARFNKPISNKAKEIMGKWAVAEGLSISKWL
ncbi:PcfJ domain-containing protein [Aquimarina sp. AU119]|uniref:PcfJ domain-containing protein n=1 Tax=Aquimarina sp. AU119 TaxID=2108528 RepID=UPI000D697AFF|nr:PcfJ domain-containing protein [Aquimarina sp. AU119]